MTHHEVGISFHPVLIEVCKYESSCKKDFLSPKPNNSNIDIIRLYFVLIEAARSTYLDTNDGKHIMKAPHFAEVYPYSYTHCMRVWKETEYTINNVQLIRFIFGSFLVSHSIECIKRVHDWVNTCPKIYEINRWVFVALMSVPWVC